MVSLQAEKLETLIYQVGAISWSGKVSLGRTNGGRHTWHLNACPIVKKNLINQSVRKLPPFSQSNKIKSWKGEDTITAFTEVTENQVSGRKKGGGMGTSLYWIGLMFFQQCLNIIIGGIKYLYIYLCLFDNILMAIIMGFR